MSDRFEFIEKTVNMHGTPTTIVADWNEWALHYVTVWDDGSVRVKSFHMDDEDNTVPDGPCDILPVTAWAVLEHLDLLDSVPVIERGGWREMGSEHSSFGWWEYNATVRD